MKAEESSRSAALNAEHRDIGPRHGAGLGGFVIAHESALGHQPAGGAPSPPAARQDFEARGRARALSDPDRQFGTETFDPRGKVSGRTAAFGGFGKHRLEACPLGIREAGFADGDFRAPTEPALKMSRRIRKRMSIHSSLFVHSLSSTPPRSTRLSPKTSILTVL